MAVSFLGPRIPSALRRLAGASVRAFHGPATRRANWGTRRQTLQLEMLENKVLLTGDLGVQSNTQIGDDSAKDVEVVAFGDLTAGKS